MKSAPTTLTVKGELVFKKAKKWEAKYLELLIEWLHMSSEQRSEAQERINWGMKKAMQNFQKGGQTNE